MHEAGFVQTALDLAAARARAAGARRIHRIGLRVGVLSGVVPEALQFAFAALSPATVAAGAILAIEEVAAVAHCPACQAEFPAADYLAMCPACGHGPCALRQGREIELTTLEIS